MNQITAKLEKLKNKPLQKYALTRFLVLDILAHILKLFPEGREFLRDNEKMSSPEERDNIIGTCAEILSGIVVDLNYEVDRAGDDFDYKSEFKSPEAVKRWRESLLSSYEKDFNRQKTPGFGTEIA